MPGGPQESRPEPSKERPKRLSRAVLQVPKTMKKLECIVVLGLFWRAAKSALGEPQESSTRGPGGPQEDPREAARKAQRPRRLPRRAPGGLQERPCQGQKQQKP